MRTYLIPKASTTWDSVKEQEYSQALQSREYVDSYTNYYDCSPWAFFVNTHRDLTEEEWNDIKQVVENA